MFDATLVPVRRALLSVSDKTGLVDLARGLDALGVSLISTGGTARALREAGLPVTDVSAVTGFPEIMAGRVKTLHPKIHGGLLGRRGIDDAVMAEHDIAGIDLLVVNLYPFEQVTAAPDCTFLTAIEHIDIGGPAMLRAAAKNHEHVAAVVDPADYAELIETLRRDEGTTLDLRRRLAAKAFAHTARYDGAIANWLGARQWSDRVEQFPPSLHLAFERKALLRYGENPHQNAALYLESPAAPGSAAGARVLAGKELSSTNSPTGAPRRKASRRSARPRPASSSSTPIPAAWQSAPPRATPTTRRMRPIRCRRSAASSPSISRSTPPPRARSSSASSSRW